MSDDQNTYAVVQIGAGDLLWRRLHASQIVRDIAGGERVSSGAFTGPELSVDLARLVEGNDFRFTMGAGAGVAEFVAEAAIRKGLSIEHAPLPGNVAHTLVHGKKTESIQRHLARQSTLRR